MRNVAANRQLLSSMAVWTVSLTSCSSTPTPSSGPDASTSVVTSPTDAPPASSVTLAVASTSPNTAPPILTDAALDGELSARSVTSEKLDFSVLYSWTTDEQLVQLDKGSALLTQETSTKRGPALFDDLVFTEAQQNRDVARLLWHKGFAKKRFAWTNAFSTLGGEPTGSYGAILLRIELKKEAWVLDYDRGIVHGLDGTRHTPEELTKTPERLGLVYHNGPAFREFVLVNESMIARFSAGAAASVQSEIHSEVDFLNAMAARLDAAGSTPAQLATFARTVAMGTFNRGAELRERAKALDGKRTATKTAIDRELNATFSLGGARAPLTPACRLVRKDKQVTPEYRGSYVRPATTSYQAICEDEQDKADGCDARHGPQPSDAVCLPIPGFFL